jgi:hypothetical protein
MATLFKKPSTPTDPSGILQKTIKERFVTAGFNGPLPENIAI